MYGYLGMLGEGLVQQVLRVLRLCLGSIVASAMLLGGLKLYAGCGVYIGLIKEQFWVDLPVIGWAIGGLGVFGVCSSVFVFMYTVADDMAQDVCPCTSVVLRRSLEGVLAITALLALSPAVWVLFRLGLG